MQCRYDYTRVIHPVYQPVLLLQKCNKREVESLIDLFDETTASRLSFQYNAVITTTQQHILESEFKANDKATNYHEMRDKTTDSAHVLRRMTELFESMPETVNESIFMLYTRKYKLTS